MFDVYTQTLDSLLFIQTFLCVQAAEDAPRHINLQLLMKHQHENLHYYMFLDSDREETNRIHGG